MLLSSFLVPFIQVDILTFCYNAQCLYLYLFLLLIGCYCRWTFLCFFSFLSCLSCYCFHADTSLRLSCTSFIALFNLYRSFLLRLVVVVDNHPQFCITHSTPFITSSCYIRIYTVFLQHSFLFAWLLRPICSKIHSKYYRRLLMSHTPSVTRFNYRPSVGTG